MSSLQDALSATKAKIGTEVGVSNWIKVDQKMIDEFAVTTHDEQWIHVDPERAAKETPFGGTIAHGFLTLSLLSKFVSEVGLQLEGLTMGVNYGFDKLRFLAPVRAGARIRARFKLNSVTEKKPGQFLMSYGVTVDIEGEDIPALIADWLGMQVV